MLRTTEETLGNFAQGLEEAVEMPQTEMKTKEGEVNKQKFSIKPTILRRRDTDRRRPRKSSFSLLQKQQNQETVA